MGLSPKNRFQKVTSRPRWEGVIFTDLDFADPRISIFAAEPIPELKDYIEYIWYMTWDIPQGERLQGIVVPNPCAKLVTLQQNNQTFPAIIVSAKDQAELFELQGSGATVGFDFKPGGLYAISGGESEEFLKNVPLVSKEFWLETILSTWVSEAERSLLNLLTQQRKNSFKKISLLMGDVLTGSVENPEEMANRAGWSLRTLQRIFQDEVHISPRDLLRIYRFNETIRKVGQDDFKAFAEIALESGFFDQPHMINEFQKLVATPPAKFRRYL